MRKAQQHISNQFLIDSASVPVEPPRRKIERPKSPLVVEATEGRASVPKSSGGTRSAVPDSTAAPRAPPAGVEPLAVTVKQACKASNLGPTTIWKLISTGALATVRIGRRRLVLYASLRALLGA